MQQMAITSWAEFKELVSRKTIPIQYVESENDYQLYAPENNEFLWSTNISKDGGEDVIDWETNFKDSANSPLEIKSGFGRPIRFASSPQPLNTTEMWEGFHVEMAADEFTKTLDIGFDTLVYMKGGKIYCDDANPNDKIDVDIVVKSSPNIVVTAGILKNVYVSKQSAIDFISSECMLMPNTVMMRVTYTKTEGDNTTRCISALADFFKPNA